MAAPMDVKAKYDMDFKASPTPEQSDSVRPCRYFKMPGGCWFGSNCLFYHEGEEKSGPDPGVCRYFRTPSGCRFGDKCRFIHIPELNGNLLYREDNADKNHCPATTDFCLNQEEFPEPLLDVTSSEEDHSDSEHSAPATESSTSEEKDVKMADWKPKESYSCGECSKVFKGKDAYDELLRHNLDMLCKMDKTHLTFLSSSHWFNHFVICGACGKDFARARDLLRHLVDKSKVVKQKRDQELHHSLLEEVARAFADRDVGLTTPNESQEELLIYLTSQMESDKDSDSSEDELGLGLYMLSEISRMGKLNKNDYEKELEERMENCGFTEKDVEELLCQGIKPWDDEAHLALAVLHGDYY